MPTGPINRDEHPALDEWLSEMEGTSTPQTSDGRDVNCDVCQRQIQPHEPITSYCSHRLLNDSDEEASGIFHLLRVYCVECDRQELVFPCQEYHEILLSGTLDEYLRLQDLGVVDFSSDADGVPYNPRELWEKTHPDVPWGEFIQVSAMFSHDGREVHLGPGDIIDDFLFHGISPETVISPNGSISVSDDVKERFRND